MLHVWYCPLETMGYWAIGTFDLTHFIYFSIPVNDRAVTGEWEWWWGRSGRRSHCAERRLPVGFQRIAFETNLVWHCPQSRCVTISKRLTHSRNGKCCRSKESAEYFVESWETLSTGVELQWNPVVQNVSYRFGSVSLVTFLIRAASLKEQGEGCQCAGEGAALCHLQGSVPGQEGPELNRCRGDLVGCWEVRSPDFAEGN